MKTVLITGATEGIGYEFVRIFAQKGCDLVLVARNENKLKAIQLEFSNVYIAIYAKDLSLLENAVAIFDDLTIRKIRIDYLINNAGFGINGEYTEISWEKELQMLNLNMITLAYYTKVFAKEMRNNGFGRILNIASTASFQPGPYMAGYCASKAFVLSLSEAVNFEMRKTNVRVTVLCPGVTDTKFHEVAATQKTFMSKLLSHATAEEVAVYGYRIMIKGRAMRVYGFMNKLIVASNRFLTRKLLISVAAKLLK